MADRKRAINRIIDSYVREVARHFRVSRVVLFGSHARRRARPDSDIDLALFLDEPLGRRKMTIMADLSATAWRIDPRIEALPFEAKELRAPDPTTLVAEILRYGRIVYSAG